MWVPWTREMKERNIPRSQPSPGPGGGVCGGVIPPCSHCPPLSHCYSSPLCHCCCSHLSLSLLLSCRDPPCQQMFMAMVGGADQVSSSLPSSSSFPTLLSSCCSLLIPLSFSPLSCCCPLLIPLSFLPLSHCHSLVFSICHYQ
jgi:hypothetical protein